MSEEVMSRIIWLGKLTPQEYLVMLSTGDIMIDPYPFGGGVTTLEVSLK
jgi:predicted O-linked N-acetylglucosamine transferase (SPINDLY family)